MRHSHPSLPRPVKVEHIVSTTLALDEQALVSRLRSLHVPQADITRALQQRRTRIAFDTAQVASARKQDRYGRTHD